MFFGIRIGPLPENVVFCLLYVRFFTTVYLCTQVLIAVIAKNLIIFHGHYIELVDDETIVKLSRFVCFIWALFITFVESRIIDVSKTLDFVELTTGKDQILIENKYSDPYAVIFSLILVDVLVILYFHVKIEIYKAKGTSPNIGRSNLFIQNFPTRWQSQKSQLILCIS